MFICVSVDCKSLFLSSTILVFFLCFSQGLPLWVKVMNIEIIVLGTVAGIASTYSAIKAIISSDFSKPCYV